MVKVYAIRNETSVDVYIGTTEQTLAERLRTHRTLGVRYAEGKTTYCSSFPIVACPTASIELLEDLGDCDKETRKARERWWIETTPNRVNKNIPGHTREERLEYLRRTARERRADPAYREACNAKRRKPTDEA
jgi:hypothetical protein